MAGFAVVMEFLTWGFLLCVAALIAAILLYRRAKSLTPSKSSAARTFRLWSIATPFLAVFWIAGTLDIYTDISNKFAHQSVGFSPDPYVTLPNGYVVGSLNTYCGYVRVANAHTDIPWTGPGYVRGIIDISFKDGVFEGTYLDSHSNLQPNGTDAIRRFAFDTRDQSIKTFATGEQSDFTDQQNKVHSDQQSYWVLYETYRHQWPTVAFWIILLFGEAMIVMCFFRAQSRVS